MHVLGRTLEIGRVTNYISKIDSMGCAGDKAEREYYNEKITYTLQGDKEKLQLRSTDLSARSLFK